MARLLVAIKSIFISSLLSSYFLSSPYRGYIVVSTFDSTDETAESEVWKLYNVGTGRVNCAPFPADLLIPENNQVVPLGDSDSVLLTWEASNIDRNIVSYQLLLDTENPPFTNRGTTSVSEISIDVQSGTTYYWYIDTIDSSNNRSISDVFSFSTQ